MRITIDGTTLTARDGGPGAGVEAYTRHLSAAMLEMGEQVDVVRPVGTVPFVSRHLSVPLLAAWSRADVLLCPSGHIPLGWFGRAVIVVHDLTVHEHPEWFPKPTSWMDARSIRRAEKIIAISEATKAQIGRLFPDALAKTVVVYPGGGEGVEIPRQTMGQDVVLFVGTIEPRKNLLNALAAFDAFLRLRPDHAATTRFVLAGRLGWKAEPIVEAVEQMNRAWQDRAGGAVIQPLGYVSEQEKRELYARASCLLFPSWEEGFGLPVVEAMAAGCPVITSNRGALPEVAGDAAFVVEPDDVGQMALALSQCILMPEAMEEMTRAAKNRAAQFAWTRAASEMLAIISSASTR